MDPGAKKTGAHRAGGDSGGGLHELLPVVYDELHRLAELCLRRERPDHTLQPTALVHEAYLRLIDQRQLDVHDRARFFGLAAETMRRILVNHAHTRNTAKRGGDAVRVTLDEAANSSEDHGVDLVALDDALTALAQLDERQARIVELRFFAGLSIEETGEVLGVSPATVKREWAMAKAWLRREIGAG